ncbi:MAG: hypothetical protein EBR82_20195 [Caulobacteraceae bacterium]|nr:hypothetical protein [Caulobacteraceae bacterium]
MARHTDVAAFGAAMEKRFANVGLTAKAVHEVLYHGGRRDHFEFTAGKIKTAELKAAGHPFARQGIAQRGNKSGMKLGGKKGLRVNLLPINEQTRGLRRSFYSTGPAGADQVVKMGFRIRYAKFVLSPTGTSRMVARGFYSAGGKSGAIRMRHRLRLAVARKLYRQLIKKGA